MVNFKDLHHSYDQRSHWSWDIDRQDVPANELVCPCDPSGYVLSKLEIEYSWINSADWRHEDRVLRKPWLSQDGVGNVVLDHAWIFERKAYDGAAKKQIEAWAKVNPILGKLLLVKSLWGFSMSLDYADADGNIFEIYHSEHHGRDLSRVESSRRYITSLVTSTDWHSVARKILTLRDQWQHLSLPDQRRWKNDYVDGL